METKLFEIRDRGTFIPALAIKLESVNEAERFLLSRAGFGQNPIDHLRYVELIHLEGQRVQYDIFNWGPARTMGVAHDHILKNWDTLKSGDVICVEYILGERDSAKESERITTSHNHSQEG